MTNDELQKLAAALTDCGKALLKISEAMAVKEGNPPASEAKSEKAEKPLTLEDVRKVAADKARKGFTEEVRSLIQKYGADKLSGSDTAQYKAFLKVLEVIGHAGYTRGVVRIFLLSLAGLPSVCEGMCQAAGYLQ